MLVNNYEIKPGANLQWANLRRANLRRANLRKADLQWANLQWANLQEANLQGANLQGANLQGAKLPKFQIPQEGTLTVFKKLRGNIIAKLLIPEDAKRTATLIGRKCRASKATVLKLSNGGFCGSSIQNKTFYYKVNETVYPNKYCDDIRIECSHGIHFFLTEEEAREY